MILDTAEKDLAIIRRRTTHIKSATAVLVLQPCTWLGPGKHTAIRAVLDNNTQARRAKLLCQLCEPLRDHNQLYEHWAQGKACAFMPALLPGPNVARLWLLWLPFMLCNGICYCSPDAHEFQPYGFTWWPFHLQFLLSPTPKAQYFYLREVLKPLSFLNHKPLSKKKAQIHREWQCYVPSNVQHTMKWKSWKILWYISVAIHSTESFFAC